MTARAESHDEDDIFVTIDGADYTLGAHITVEDAELLIADLQEAIHEIRNTAEAS